MTGTSAAAEAPIDLQTDRYLRERQLLELLPITDSTLWRWIRDGKFPRPVKLGPGTSAWRVSDYRAWEQGVRPNNPQQQTTW